MNSLMSEGNIPREGDFKVPALGSHALILINQNFSMSDFCMSEVNKTANWVTCLDLGNLFN